ncbi:MAG: mandelate racemase/muconate lactonizing enzyme family protein [Pirellulales bacterium]
MKIESVDFYYLSIPKVEDVGDGSQDALLVRVQAGEHVGWGECEAAPLPTIAGWICPMSHSACKPVSASVLGERLESADDIRRIHQQVRANSFDLLQADHVLSGIDIALWDLLGRRLGEPVYRLLGDRVAHPKLAYASQLFGDDPQTTFRRAEEVARRGYRAAKFGWGPFGRGELSTDEQHVRAAREGLGPDGMLLIDAGTIWNDDVELAALRLPVLAECGAVWLEEPFVSGAFQAYAELARRSSVKLAGGEGCHNEHQAMGMIDFAGLGFVQIDTGRVGGITSARRVAEYAVARGVQFVNHTFTTHLALSASLQPYAGMSGDDLCEYPVDPSALAREFTRSQLIPGNDGRIAIPDGPGLGIEPDVQALQKYLVDVEIRVAGRTLFRSVPLQ